MNELKIVLTGERGRSWNPTLRKHWTEFSKENVDVQWLVRAAIPFDAEPFDVPVHIRIDAFYTGKMIDSDNISAKLYIDGLKGKLIRDDDWRYVRDVTTRCHQGAMDMVAITITPAE